MSGSAADGSSLSSAARYGYAKLDFNKAIFSSGSNSSFIS